MRVAKFMNGAGAEDQRLKFGKGKPNLVSSFWRGDAWAEALRSWRLLGRGRLSCKLRRRLFDLEGCRWTGIAQTIHRAERDNVESLALECARSLARRENFGFPAATGGLGLQQP